VGQPNVAYNISVFMYLFGMNVWKFFFSINIKNQQKDVSKQRCFREWRVLEMRVSSRNKLIEKKALTEFKPM
jgi:hypothetical protein